jgi:hypothetical protein
MYHENDNNLSAVENNSTHKVQKCLLLAHDVINYLSNKKM